MRFKATAASIFIVLATVAALSPTRVAAEEDFKNTEHLLKWCKQPETSANHAFCVGFVSGIAEMMKLVALTAHGHFRMNYGMCVSDPDPGGNAEVQAFINWTEKNPKNWGMLNEVGVILALSETWPCTADAKPAQ